MNASGFKVNIPRSVGRYQEGQRNSKQSAAGQYEHSFCNVMHRPMEQINSQVIIYDKE